MNNPINNLYSENVTKNFSLNYFNQGLNQNSNIINNNSICNYENELLNYISNFNGNFLDESKLVLTILDEIKTSDTFLVINNNNLINKVCDSQDKIILKLHKANLKLIKKAFENDD